MPISWFIWRLFGFLWTLSYHKRRPHIAWQLFTINERYIPESVKLFWYLKRWKCLTKFAICFFILIIIEAMIVFKRCVSNGGECVRMSEQFLLCGHFLFFVELGLFQLLRYLLLKILKTTERQLFTGILV